MFVTLLFCEHLFAQTPNNGKFVLLPEVPVAVALNAPVVASGTEASDVDASLYTIFNNFGKKPNCYDNEGWVVSGKDSSLGYSQYIAMRFTPKADATVTELKLALFRTTDKPGGAVISLNEDMGNQPGNPLHTWVTSKLGNSGKLPCVYTMVRASTVCPSGRARNIGWLPPLRGPRWTDGFSRTRAPLGTLPTTMTTKAGRSKIPIFPCLPCWVPGSPPGISSQLARELHQRFSVGRKSPCLYWAFSGTLRLRSRQAPEAFPRALCKITRS